MLLDNILPILLVALAVDAVIGDPPAFYRIIPHPAVIMGRLVGLMDETLNRPALAHWFRRLLGLFAIIALSVFWGAVAVYLTRWLDGVPSGWIILGVIMSTLLAQKSLYQHVGDVASALEAEGLDAGRAAVGKIVGRQTDSLDEAGISRASLESLAENFSDGVVAPVFWALCFGLPGLLIYKSLNTADSMIGHLNQKHGDFGWAAAKLDDFANLIPSRIAGLLIVIAALVHRPGGAADSLKTLWRDGRKHRSPNAGVPEAAMAGALDVRLSGPRVYDGQAVDEPWLGEGREDATPADIGAGLRVYVNACVVMFVLLVGLVAES